MLYITSTHSHSQHSGVSPPPARPVVYTERAGVIRKRDSELSRNCPDAEALDVDGRDLVEVAVAEGRELACQAGAVVRPPHLARSSAGSARRR